MASEPFDLSLAITGSGGAGAITTGELLLSLAGENGRFGMMRRSFGPQIRGGEAAALLRLADAPVACMNDHFDLLLALDWNNADRFAEELPMGPHSLIVADPGAGKMPPSIWELGARIIELPIAALAKEVDAGRPNMVALGLLARWLGLASGAANPLIESVFGGKGERITSGSLAAFEKGYQQAPIPQLGSEGSILQRTASVQRYWQINGSEACGLGALRGGIRFAAAYPITPASELLEWLSPRLERLGGSLLQAEDELASINMVIGASFGGVPSMTATSGPGFALMTESMGLAMASETPAVVIDVMRAGPSTGIPTKSEQSDLDIALCGLHGDAPHLVLGALDHADCILTTEWGVRLAEALQTLAVILTDQNLAQSRVLIPPPEYRLDDIPPRKTAPASEDYCRYRLTDDGVSPMAIPGTPQSTYVADGLEHAENAKPSAAAADHEAQLKKRLRKLEDFDFGAHWADIRGEGELAILTWGSSTAAAREAAERLASCGRPVRLIALRLLSPARPEHLARALDGVTRVLVVEQSQTRQFHRYLRAWYDFEAELRVLAKPGPLLLTPGEIVAQIEQWSET